MTVKVLLRHFMTRGKGAAVRVGSRFFSQRAPRPHGKNTAPRASLGCREGFIELTPVADVPPSL